MLNLPTLFEKGCARFLLLFTWMNDNVVGLFPSERVKFLLLWTDISMHQAYHHAVPQSENAMWSIQLMPKVTAGFSLTNSTEWGDDGVM